VLPIATSDRLRQAVGSGSVLYHCDVADLKTSTAIVYVIYFVYPPATTSADWRLRIPGECLAVGMGGMVCIHFLRRSLYVCTSLVALKSLFAPPTATRLPFT
jgi:hypothetical protein